MYPLLSLSQITLNTQLARRLPRRLAYYHLALPIAYDEDHIAVAMAHPDNQAVVKVLEAVLGASVTPVRSAAEEIKRSLDYVWQEDSEAGASTLLYWTDKPECEANVRSYAAEIAAALSLNCEDTQPESMTALLQRSQEVRPALIVCCVADSQLLAQLVNRSTASILLVREAQTLPRNILHVLRGHTPDRRVLDWVIPIAHRDSAPVTLLAAATPSYGQGSPLLSDFANLLSPNHSAHLTEYGQVLASVNVTGRVKIRQGVLEDVIVSELSERSYDMVAIAAEAYGDFVYRVLQRLNGNACAFLVIKP